MAVTLRAAYAKQGLLRMVAHRDMSTHLKRMFLRARLPLVYTQGFSPRPKMSFGPPLPLGATCGEDWMEVDLEEGISGDDFLERVGEQSLDGLEWVSAYLKGPDSGKLQDLLQYAEWLFEPYDGEGAEALSRTILEAANGEILVLRKRNKRGKLREVDVRPRIKLAEAHGQGLRVIMGASPSAEAGALGLFDFLKVTAPDLEEHPMTVYRIHRARFLRLEGEDLVDAVDIPGGG